MTISEFDDAASEDLKSASPNEPPSVLPKRRLLYSRASLELCVEFVVQALLMKAGAAEAEAFRISQMAAGRPETEAGMRWYAGNLRSIAAEFRATAFVEAVVDSIRNVS